MRNGRPLDFLLQINLADLQGLQSGLDLPAQGLLSFFYDTQEQPWGYDPAHGDGHCIVLLEAGDLQRLLSSGLGAATSVLGRWRTHGRGVPERWHRLGR